jgi:hypothetical protein
VTSAIPPDNFDPGKPYYRLVMVYWPGYHGFKELALRGILDQANAMVGTPTLAQLLDSVDTGNADSNAGLRKLREPRSLLVACDGTRISGPVGLTALGIVDNHARER